MYMHMHIKINACVACVVRKDVRGANKRNRTLNIKNHIQTRMW